MDGWVDGLMYKIVDEWMDWWQRWLYRWRIKKGSTVLIFPWNDCHESTNCNIMIRVVVEILPKLKDIE